MTARLIDGKAIAASVRAETAIRAARLAAAGTVPGLAVVIVGEDPASRLYVRSKAQACEAAGLRSWVHAMPVDTPLDRLVAFVHELNGDPEVHGILVQLPLPGRLDARLVIEAIDPMKDVDGFHYQNVGALVVGDPAFYPCTPWGVMKLLEHEGVPVDGAHAVVVGRSTIVGKPMALMLLNAGATVTICHSRTRDLAAQTRQADILVAAAGRAHIIGAGMVKAGATVIDVGINRLPDGKLVGDVDFAAIAPVAARITPVPGGVGPMTIAMLIANTVRSAERAAGFALAAGETRIA
ncbi:MAG: bifunctional methylenetetrahydrofolate dehydrogenase/methenyltetrahydrofolate cyclohydrolase FolD [Betaproteobacteria bacterium]|nr:bifunctional methylenetetrahydrofolate dehydrogenase/methenyltetrahydrofolate cyclohydrolase FolD [Betaproteobacteria bacterium]